MKNKFLKKIKLGLLSFWGFCLSIFFAKISWAQGEIPIDATNIALYGVETPEAIYRRIFFILLIPVIIIVVITTLIIFLILRNRKKKREDKITKPDVKKGS